MAGPLSDVPRFLTAKEVAERLRLDVETVRRYAKRHATGEEGTKLRAVKVGRRWLFDPRDVQELLEAPAPAPGPAAQAAAIAAQVQAARAKVLRLRRAL